MNVLAAIVFLLALQDPFASCEAELRAAEEASESYMCFYFTAQRTQKWDEGVRRLTRLLRELPENHWLELVRGHIQIRDDQQSAEQSYRSAAEGFRAEGEREGEILARTNLTRLLQRQGRIEAAGKEVERVMRVADEADDPMLLARALILEADHAREHGRDLATAYRSLRRAERIAFPDGPHGLKRNCLAQLANVAFLLGRFRESLQAYERLIPLLREDEDDFAEAMITFNVANARLRQLEKRPDPGGREEVSDLARRVLQLARASGNRRAELRAHRLLGALLPREPEREPEIRRHLERCVSLASELGHPDRTVSCLWTMAEFLADSDPEGANRAIQEAVDLARASDTRWYLAFALRARADVAWKTLSHEEAVAHSLHAIEAVESLRRLQGEEQGRAELFSDWTREYYLLSGRLLNRDERGPDDVGLAFDVIERMRSRVLLEALEAGAGLTELPADHPLRARHEALLERIATLQRRLLEPTLSPADRAEALDALHLLELDEADVRVELRQTDAAYEIREPEFVTIEDVQRLLQKDEAMLSFQVALWRDVYDDFGGGSWLSVITREGVRVVEIPGRVELEPAVPVFIGLLARRDGTESRAAVRLYDELLREGLSTLPATIDRLIVVPDGVLHHLPFESLRPSGEDPSVGVEYEISVVPSATLWRRWRQNEASPAEAPVLAVADPELGGGTASTERSVVLREGLRLGALPHARREGRSAVGRLGGASRLLAGPEATEHAVKAAGLDRFAILHFAAHAVADNEYPERSAVVLAPGSETEDGLLQVREIGELDLAGRVVVLSACRTASGATLGGEGVLSLARAFFQAGAQAVIGSRWPLRDDDARFLFDQVYKELARGESLASALRASRRQAIGAGLPASAWSGLVLLGNGSFVPFPEGRDAPSSPRWTWIVIMLLAVSLFIRWRTRG